MKSIIGLMMTMAVMFVMTPEGYSAQPDRKGADDRSLQQGESRATLDPGLFSDAKVRKAYQVAKEIPGVLDSIYCFCKCKESPAFRHKSLLSCFVDNHAAV